MRITYRIARAEICALFFSPIAWLVLIVFIVQSGIRFNDILSGFVRFQNMGIPPDLLTEKVFSNRSGFFFGVLSNLYFYIPLLSMGLISRETSSGSIKLLLSSPIRIGEVVLGKYLAIITYGLLLVIIVAIYAFAGSFSIRNMDIGLIISGLIGIYLVICAYAAIGLFMSSLTTYQVVAALSTLMVLGLLGYVGNMFQRIDIVRDITWFLSIAGRADTFTSGLILSRDVCYFVIIILLFMSLTFLKLLFGIKSLSFAQKTARYGALVAGVLLIGYISTRPSLARFADLTADKRRTLTKNSQDIVQQFKSPVTITTYVNILASFSYYGTPEMRNLDESIFAQYRLFMPDIKMNYKYYYDRPLDTTNNRVIFGANKNLSLPALAKKIADARDMDIKDITSPMAFRKEKDLRTEEYAFTRELQYNGRKTYLRMFSDPTIVPSEKEITAALKRLLMPPPHIAYLTGNEERRLGGNGDKDYKVFFTGLPWRFTLVNLGFDVDTLSLARQPIPDSIAVLVIADPKTPFSDSGLKKIEDYIDKGGNLLLCGEPSRQANTAALMRKLGISMVPGAIASHSNDYEPDLLLASLPADVQRVAPALVPYLSGGAKIVFPGASVLSYNDSAGFNIKPFIVTSAGSSWNTKLPLDPEAHNLKPDFQAGDMPGPFPVALTLTRKLAGKEQRIMVCGDADFLAGKGIYGAVPKTINAEFATYLFGWFSNGQFPIDVSRPRGRDNMIKVTKSEISMLKWIFYGILPGFILLLGMILLIRRKRS